MNNWLNILTLCCLSIFFQEVSFSQVQIKGKFNNCTQCKAQAIITHNDLQQNRDFESSQPDSYGNFVFDLKTIYQPRIILLEINAQKIPIYVEPNEKIWITIQQGQYGLEYQFDNNLVAENNHLKYFFQQYGWISAKNRTSYTLKSNINIRGTLHYEFMKQPEGLRMNYFLKKYNELKQQAEMPSTLSTDYQDYMKIYIQHASNAYLYGFASLNQPLSENTKQLVLRETFDHQFDDSENVNDAFIPHLQAYCNYLLSSAEDIDDESFSSSFYYLWQNAQQLPIHIREQYLIHKLKQAVNADNIYSIQPTILAFTKSLTDLDRMADLLSFYEKTKEQANGRKAPQFVLEDLQGNQVSLNSFLGKNVYLAFWSSSCRPCIEGMKKSVNNKYYLQGDDIRFVYISTDYTRSTWKANKYVKNATKNDIHLWAGKSSTQLKDYNAISLPTYYFINRQGNFLVNFPKSWERDFVNFVRNR